LEKNYISRLNSPPAVQKKPKSSSNPPSRLSSPQKVVEPESILSSNARSNSSLFLPFCISDSFHGINEALRSALLTPTPDLNSLGASSSELFQVRNDSEILTKDGTIKRSSSRGSKSPGQSSNSINSQERKKSPKSPQSQQNANYEPSTPIIDIDV